MIQSYSPVAIREMNFRLLLFSKSRWVATRMLADGYKRKNSDAICGKVLAEELTSDKNFAVEKEWNVNGEKVVIAVEKIG